MFAANVTIAPDAERIGQPWEARAGVMIPKRGSSCGRSCRRTNIRSAVLVMRNLHADFLGIASNDVASQLQFQTTLPIQQKWPFYREVDRTPHRNVPKCLEQNTAAAEVHGSSNSEVLYFPSATQLVFDIQLDGVPFVWAPIAWK
jgi:hypothetical protein